jgi:hypothetical protein
VIRKEAAPTEKGKEMTKALEAVRKWAADLLPRGVRATAGAVCCSSSYASLHEWSAMQWMVSAPDAIAPGVQTERGAMRGR